MKYKSPSFYFIEQDLVKSFEIVNHNKSKKHSYRDIENYSIWFIVSLFIGILIYGLIFSTNLISSSFALIFNIFFSINVLSFLATTLRYKILFYISKMKHTYILNQFKKNIFLNEEKLQELLQFIDFSSLTVKNKNMISKDFSEKKLTLPTLELLSTQFNLNLVDFNYHKLNELAQGEKTSEKKTLAFFNKSK